VRDCRRGFVIERFSSGRTGVPRRTRNWFSRATWFFTIVQSRLTCCAGPVCFASGMSLRAIGLVPKRRRSRVTWQNAKGLHAPSGTPLRRLWAGHRRRRRPRRHAFDGRRECTRWSWLERRRRGAERAALLRGRRHRVAATLVELGATAPMRSMSSSTRPRGAARSSRQARRAGRRRSRRGARARVVFYYSGHARSTAIDLGPTSSRSPSCASACSRSPRR